MRIIVIGGSRLGVAVVEQLLEGDHDVVLVDKSRDRLDAMSDRLDCGFIEGDGTLPQTLRDAYGDGADALMLMTNHDDVNILAAVVGRSIGFERVVLQIVQSQLLDVCEELGFKDVVTPHATVASSIVHSLETRDRVWSELDAVSGVHFTTCTVPKRMESRTLGSIELPQHTRAVAISRGKGAGILDPEECLQEGDEVLIAAAEGMNENLQAVFRPEDTD